MFTSLPWMFHTFTCQPARITAALYASYDTIVSATLRHCAHAVVITALLVNAAKSLSMAHRNSEEVEDTQPFLAPNFSHVPALVHMSNSNTIEPFLQRPWLAPLLFPNESSDARDHCANERTFLSWLRLSVYLAIVSSAIVISFHLKTEASELEIKMALPLGIVFWLLSVACLASGLANYIRTVTKYSRRQALVQSGWKTQVVFTVIATAIVAACVLFLAIDAKQNGEKSQSGDSLFDALGLGIVS